MSFIFAVWWYRKLPSTMLGPERHRTILRLLGERGRLTLAEIGPLLGVSSATVRRDASMLVEFGLAQRTHGGLLPPSFSLSEPAYHRKTEKAAGIKARLARTAVRLLPEHGTVFIDAGTTCLEVGRALLDRPNLRIFTNSVPLLGLAADAAAAVVGLGGEVRKTSLSLVGGLAQAWMEQLRFDAAVIGASGLDGAAGPSTTELTEAGLKVDALRRARMRVLIAHGEKWERPAAVRIAPWSAFHHFITDRNLGRSERTAIGAAGVKLHIVSLK